MMTNPYYSSGSFGNDTLEPVVTAALRVAHEIESPFTREFFSKRNIDFLQNKMIEATKKYTGMTIGRQDDKVLVMIMSGIYVEYSTATGNMAEDIKKLNTLVFSECMKQILPGVRSYALYVRDASAPYGGAGTEAFRRPILSTTKGSRALEGAVFFN